MKAKNLKLLLNLYPPFLGAGIRVKHVATDFSEVIVEMKLRWFNKNPAGTHFGGSLYTMVDPIYMLMLINILGREYIVWDKSATIDFISPGRGKMSAKFELVQEQIDEVIAKTENGIKYLPEYRIDVLDEKKQLVARVTKTLYIKRKTA